MFSLPATATQPPGKNAWEELRLDSDAYNTMKRKCQEDAGEEFFETRENVRGIYLESDERALSYVSGGPSSYGISYSNPPYMYLRNGLYFIEYGADFGAVRKFGAVKTKDGYRYIRFDTKNRNDLPVEDRSTPIRVSYKRTTTDGEERLGVYGRLIEVVDDSTKSILARRRDYVWLNPNRNGPHGGYICPTILEEESFPISFLNKVINVQSYPCRREFEESMRSRKNKNLFSPENELLLKRMNACQAEYFK